MRTPSRRLTERADFARWNLLSILAPFAISAGSLRAKNAKLIPILLHSLFAIVFPLAMLPMLLPIGIEFLLEEFAGLTVVPTSLVLSVIECAVLVYLYRRVLDWESDLLQAREQTVLEIVAARAE